jgi:hypothetical protein
MGDDLRHVFWETAIGDKKLDEKHSLPKNLKTRKRLILWGGILAALVGVSTTLLFMRISDLVFPTERPPITTLPIENAKSPSAHTPPIENAKSPSLLNSPMEKLDLVDIFRVEWVGGGRL